jgi:hypothetical protein
MWRGFERRLNYVYQLDHEGKKPVNLGSAFPNQNPCPGIGARHQRIPFFR